MTSGQGFKDIIWICGQCATERGYLFSEVKRQNHTIGSCSACGGLAIVYAMDSLDHVGDDLKDPGEQ
jgi:hypothetical protein